MDLVLALLIAVTTLAVYSQVRGHDFVAFDDPQYISANEYVKAGLTPNGIGWAFTTMHDGNWFPLTWLSHMADVQLFGLQAGLHHLTNAVLHAASTFFLFVAFRRMTGARWPSALVAILFGLHPLHVESVAWVAERKDVLSGLFWMVTFAGYAHYVARPSWPRYLVVILPFTLGLLSKSMIVTLPFVLLLLDVWPLGRLRLGVGQPPTAGAAPGRAKPSRRRAAAQRSDGPPSRTKEHRREQGSERPMVRRSEGPTSGFGLLPPLAIVLEKVPLLALTAAASIITWFAQHGAGAVATPDLSVGLRVANAVVSYVAYIKAFFWPAGLAVFYPLPQSIPWWQAGAAAALLAVVCVLAWRRLTAGTYLAVGWCFFLGTLVPVIGLVQVGSQARADRYTYVPAIGLSMMLAWGLAEIARRRPSTKAWTAAFGVVIAAACAILTWQQLKSWRNTTALYEHALAVTTDNYVAHDGLGAVLREQGHLDEAIAHYQEAVRIRPTYAGSQNNLGEALLAKGRAAEALPHLEESVRLDPRVREAHLNLAAAHYTLGHPAEAIAECETAVRGWPDDPRAQTELGMALAENARVDEGLAHLREALRLAPGYAEVHYDLARVLLRAGRTDEAVAEFSETLRLRPEFAEGHFNLGNVLLRQGRLDAAQVEYQAAIRLKPDFAQAHCNLGTAMVSAGRVDDAIQQFKEALRLQPDMAVARRDLELAQQARRKPAR